jgi:hypothetical protein
MTTLMEEALRNVGRDGNTYHCHSFSGPREFHDHRREIIKEYGFPIITQALIDYLVGLGRPFVDAGAGTGYLAHELRRAGADVLAMDVELGDDCHYGFRRRWIDDILYADAVYAIPAHGQRVLILSWPCYNSPWSQNVLAQYTGDMVVYIGEHWWGCTATDAFHRLLDNEWEKINEIAIPQWDGIHDRVFVYKRKLSATTKG